MNDQATGGASGLAWTISLMVTMLVAVLAIVGGIINERYKRHRSKIAVAAVMRAEISALAEITTANDTVQQWTDIAEALEAGNNIPIPNIYTPEPDHGPVFNAHVDKLGLLEAKDAEGIIVFYEYLMAIRILLKGLVSGAWEAHPHAAAVKAVQVRAGLRFWAHCEATTLWLLPSLERTTKRPFPWFTDRKN